MEAEKEKRDERDPANEVGLLGLIKHWWSSQSQKTSKLKKDEQIIYEIN